MATTQYIGARYVPIFANPIDWSNDREFEPLTIVVYKGDSYTSKQYVPKGIEVTNTKYWALTGNYNAQVEHYRADVASFSDRINNAVNIAEDVKEAYSKADKELETKLTQNISEFSESLNTVKTTVQQNTSKIEQNKTETSQVIELAKKQLETKITDVNDTLTQLDRAQKASDANNRNAIEEVKRKYKLDDANILKKFPLQSSDIGNGVITADKLSSDISLKSDISQYTVKRFGNFTSQVDNAGTSFGWDAVEIDGTYIVELQLLFINWLSFKKDPTPINNPQATHTPCVLPNYIKRPSSNIWIGNLLVWNNSEDFKTWSRLEYDKNGELKIATASGNNSIMWAPIAICLNPF